jgi:DNA-damage-inducible protein D
MKNIISNPKANQVFESFKKVSPEGVEYWEARELQPLLGYKRWEDFVRLIENTKKLDFEDQNDHIRYSPKLIKTGKGAEREVADYQLTRRGTHKVAMLGNTQECRDARTYFSDQTIKHENLTKQIDEEQRKELRKQSKVNYTSYRGSLIDAGISYDKVGIVTAQGDKTLFGKKTADIKRDNNIPEDRPLEDFLHPVGTAARMLGREMTTAKAKSNEISSLGSAIKVHSKHNSEIRGLLVNNELTPEELPILEDIEKIDELPIPKTSKLTEDDIDKLLKESKS